MSGLNIRTFAKVEPSDGENSTANQLIRNLRMQNRNDNDSDDSDAGIQYLAPDDTPADPSSLSFPRPQSVIVPKVETDVSRMAFTNDSISADQGIIVKSENQHESSGLMGSQVFNEVRPVHQSHVDGYERDAVQEQQLAALGLPTNFCAGLTQGVSGGGVTNYAEQTTVRKGQKQTYYCEICMIDLNSVDTLNSHVQGVKHVKKKIAMEAKNEALRNQGLAPETKVVRQVANPLPLQKKVPIRLQEKLRESRESIVGLSNIIEIIACSNAEVEPYYECMPCGTQGEANGMYNHLVGRQHRQQFLEKKFPNDPRYMDMKSRDLKSEIEKYKENNELHRISTTYSDEMYPWTAGKAPWSVEQGGTGIVPTGARNDINITGSKAGRRGGSFGPHIDSKEGILNKNIITSFQSLDPLKLEGSIKTCEELQHCYTLIQSLLKKAQEFHIEKVVPNEKDDLELVLAEVDASIEVAKCLPLKQSNGLSNYQRSPSPPYRRMIKAERNPSPDQNFDRNPSPPRRYQSQSPSPPSRSYRRSPLPDRRHRYSRSPNSVDRSFRDFDDFGRSSDSSRDSRSHRNDRDRRYTNDRYRDRDDNDRWDERDRSTRRPRY